jgi:glutathione peroxidase
MSDSIFNICINTLSGKPLDWADFMGRKIMVVNVASECGFTPQYAQLQALYAANSDKLVILGCPCNDFGGQEPGDSRQIEQFCQVNYGITFPLTEKINITQDPHLLYLWLTQKEKNQKGDYIVQWNFHKFLIDEDGSLYKSLPSASDPFCDDILHWIR